MRSPLVQAVFAALALVCFACQNGAPPPGVGFATDAVLYAPGDSVRLQLVNGIEQEIGYNLCFSDLERQEEGQWRTVPDPETFCTTIQHYLAPGDTAHFTKTVMTDVPAGTYRYRTSIEYRQDERQEDAVTNTFGVEE